MPAAQRLFQRLHQAAGDVARGSRPEQAVESLRPPVFFKEKPLFIRALSGWSLARLGSALDVLTEAERLAEERAEQERLDRLFGEREDGPREEQADSAVETGGE